MRDLKLFKKLLCVPQLFAIILFKNLSQLVYVAVFELVVKDVYERLPRCVELYLCA
jgi:hypothetical protein